MAKCSKCRSTAAAKAGKLLCASHFTECFERKVLATIREFNLAGKNDRIIVASSGGKDSTTTLYILNKYFGNAEALAIDEGIPGYRNLTLDALKSFCRSNGIPLHIHSYKNEFGFTLADAIKARKDISPCNLCGILRRHILNKKARGFTKIATGHNLDDEAQSIMMNLAKNQASLLSRLGPMTGVVRDKGFVKRIKPLYFCTEKEVASYATIKKLTPKFSQCPHSHSSFRAFVRDTLNDYESRNKGAKLSMVSNFLKLLPHLKQQQESAKLSHCASCGEPSSKERCSACGIVDSIRKHL